MVLADRIPGVPLCLALVASTLAVFLHIKASGGCCFAHKTNFPAFEAEIQEDGKTVS
jgi:hypothetical protein